MKSGYEPLPRHRFPRFSAWLLDDGRFLRGEQDCCAAAIAAGGGGCGAIAKQRQSRALALHPPVVKSPGTAFRIATAAPHRLHPSNVKNFWVGARDSG